MRFFLFELLFSAETDTEKGGLALRLPCSYIFTQLSAFYFKFTLQNTDGREKFKYEI